MIRSCGARYLCGVASFAYRPGEMHLHRPVKGTLLQPQTGCEGLSSSIRSRYLGRRSKKGLLASHQKAMICSTPIIAASLGGCPHHRLLSSKARSSPLELSRVLVVCKQTRFETEVANTGHNTEGMASTKKQSLKRVLSRRGLNYDRLHQSYISHVKSLAQIKAALNVRCIAYEVAMASRDGEEDFPQPYEKYDAVFAAGGDGTFLKAASEIFTSTVPLIGINTDPNASMGALCAIQSAGHFGACLDRLEQGDFDYQTRSRIRVSLSKLDPGRVEANGSESDNSDDWIFLKKVALNEIFIAERNVAHPIQHEIVVNGVTDEADVQLSSGILISTGTGSAAWIANAAKVSIDTVQRVLREARNLSGNGLVGSGYQQEEDHDLADLSKKIAGQINEDIIFEPSSALVRYFVREVVNNGLRPDPRHREGQASSVTVRSRGWDPTLTLDGIHVFALPAGQRAHFDTDPSVALLTCSFPAV